MKLGLVVAGPPSPPSDPDIRFLDREELEALRRAAGTDLLGPTDHALWLPQR